MHTLYVECERHEIKRNEREIWGGGVGKEIFYHKDLRWLSITIYNWYNKCHCIIVEVINFHS